MKIALCTELRNVEWFESRLRSLFDGDGQLAIDELWNENQLAQALRRSRYHAVVIVSLCFFRQTAPIRSYMRR